LYQKAPLRQHTLLLFKLVFKITHIKSKKNNLYHFLGRLEKIAMAAVVLIITCILGTILATGTKKAAFTFPEFQYKESSKNVS
jgi:hypothetical protein